MKPNPHCPADGQICAPSGDGNCVACSDNRGDTTSLERRAVRRYAHMCRMDHEQIGHNDSEHEQCPLCRAQDERDALSTELAEAKAEIERMREALLDFLAYFKSGNSVPVDRAVIRADSTAVVRATELIAAIIPAKGKGE